MSDNDQGYLRVNEITYKVHATRLSWGGIEVVFIVEDSAAWSFGDGHYVVVAPDGRTAFEGVLGHSVDEQIKGVKPKTLVYVTQRVAINSGMTDKARERIGYQTPPPQAAIEEMHRIARDAALQIERTFSRAFRELATNLSKSASPTP